MKLERWAGGRIRDDLVWHAKSAVGSGTLMKFHKISISSLNLHFGRITLVVMPRVDLEM